MKYIFISYLWVSIIALAGCSLLGSDDGKPDRPDIPGKIVFSAKDDAGSYQIFTMKANGEDIRQLTNFGPDDATQPSWSPDGQQIIFSSTKRGTSAGPALWVMDADGNNKQFLYNPEPDNPNSIPLAGSNARWSPDGTKVAFDFCLNCNVGMNYNIYLFDTITKNITRLTGHPASDTNPTWSPDGQRIAFVSDRDHPNEGGTDIYTLAIENGNINRLTETGNAGRQLWYSNGSNLLFWSNENLFSLGINSGEVIPIPFTVDHNKGFRPLAISKSGKNILLIVFSYKKPNSNQTIQVLDTDNGKLIDIHHSLAFNGVAWFISKNNN